MENASTAKPFWGHGKKTPPQPGRCLRTADVAWLWPGRIPLGKITLLLGDPGVGKSLLALDVAARVATGPTWPDAIECGMSNGECGINDSTLPPSPSPSPHSLFATPHSVLLLSAEDDLADTIRPRLEAGGADCSRIVALTAWASFSYGASTVTSYCTKRWRRWP
jgi:hypothetical protein